MATTLTGAQGFRHPVMDGVQLDVKQKKTTAYACSDDTPNMPKGLPKIDHEYELYISMAQDYSNLVYNISNMGIRESFNFDLNDVARNVRSYGWRLVGSAVDKGGALYVGKQISHLIQNPDSKACMITFQGSSSFQDWMANLNGKKSHFCGLVERGEECDGKQCSVRNKGSSFVHGGFRDALRGIVQCSEFQNNIRSKLSSCSSVYVTGHSLGGAQAELFAACAAKAPGQGEYGYEEDYKYIKWIPGTPRVLPEVR